MNTNAATEKTSPSKGVMTRVVIGAALATAAACAGGCTTVKPWERGNLADYTMRADRDPLAAAMTDHIYFSREASSGGRGVGGGGCGCN